MIKILVVKPLGEYLVYIMKNKSDNTFSFVNITKGHICECKFDTIEDAIKDLDNYVASGKVLSYKMI